MSRDSFIQLDVETASVIGKSYVLRPVPSIQITVQSNLELMHCLINLSKPVSLKLAGS